MRVERSERRIGPRCRWGLVVAAVAAACLVPATAGSATIDRIHAAELTAPTAVEYALLGFSVAIDGDTLVAGTPGDGPGTVHVFETNPATGLWQWKQELQPPGAAAGDEVGSSVAVYGSMIAIGAPGDDSGAGNRGAIHVYTRDTGTGVWGFDRTLGGGSYPDARLGKSVALNGKWLVAGAPGESDTGRVHVWARSDWEPQKLSAPVDAGGFLGWSVAIDGDFIVAGAPWDGNGGTQRGSAHLFFYFDTHWGYYQELASATTNGDRLGFSVALDLPNVVAGVPGADGGATNRGEVHLFRPGGATWAFADDLLAGNPNDYESLGWSVAIEGGEVFAGAPGDDTQMVSVFDLATGLREDVLVAPDPWVPAEFGTSVAVDGGMVVVGAPHEFVRGYPDVGSVHVFGDLPDSLLCGGFAVTMVGTPGDDELIGTGDATGLSRDVIRGYGGNDTILGGSGDDVICGDDGDDIILGEQGDDTLYGGDGNDRLRGATGNDTLFGGAGSDRLLPDTGSDLVDGGPGSDVVDYLAGRGPIRADLPAGTITYFFPANTWTHSVVAVEKVDGTRYDDTLIGDAKRNVLRGKQGVDQIWGGGGDDDLIGGTGDDSILGGDGDDLIKGQADEDLLEGEAGADTIRGGNGNDTLRGGNGNDLLVGGLFSHRGIFTNVIDGGPGTDVCRWWFDHPTNC